MKSFILYPPPLADVEDVLRQPYKKIIPKPEKNK
jgi:hypothetical protein